MKLRELPILDPAEMPLVALDSMNQTHREELELVNRLGGLLLRDDADTRELAMLLADWVAHTRAHFAAENQLMQLHGFPALAVHAGEHARVLARIEDLQQGWLAVGEPGPLAAFLFDEWPDWFMQHVTTMDRVTAQYVARQTGAGA